MSRGLFVTGTGTDIGKTFISALIAKRLNDAGLNTAYFKAAVSGNDRLSDGSLLPLDADYVKRISGIAQPISEMCPYVYENAVSPHLASRLEGNPVEMSGVLSAYAAITNKYDFITSEGSGGILCPLRFDDEIIMLPDVIRALDIPCLLVADAGLGTINYVVLTAEYMKKAGLRLNGIIFNNFERGNLMHEDNLKMCEYLTGVSVIDCIEKGAADLNISAEELCALYE